MPKVYVVDAHMGWNLETLTLAEFCTFARDKATAIHSSDFRAFTSKREARKFLHNMLDEEKSHG